jgi:hypothetical protein
MEVTLVNYQSGKSFHFEIVTAENDNNKVIIAENYKNLETGEIISNDQFNDLINNQGFEYIVS